jgi:hypothetical protein
MSQAGDTTAMSFLRSIIVANDGSPSPADDPTVAAHTTRLRQRLVDSAHVLAPRIGVHVDSAVAVGTAHRVIAEHIKSRLPSLVVVASRFDPVTAGLGGTPL